MPGLRAVPPASDAPLIEQRLGGASVLVAGERPFTGTRVNGWRRAALNKRLTLLLIRERGLRRATRRRWVQRGVVFRAKVHAPCQPPAHGLRIRSRRCVSLRCDRRWLWRWLPRRHPHRLRLPRLWRCAPAPECAAPHAGARPPAR